MRWVGLLVLLVAATAAAAPTIAIAPLDGDKKNAVGNAIAKVAEAEGFTVTRPKETGRAMDKLGLSDDMDSADVTRLRTKLDVDVVIHGSTDGKTAELKIAGKGIRSTSARLRFKKTTSREFEGDVKEMLAKKLKRVDEPAETKTEPAEEAPPPEEEEPVKKKKKKKKKHHDDEDEGEGESEQPLPRHIVTQAALRANVGAGFARRGLTYDASGGQQPPPVGTAGASARVEVEAYPASFSSIQGIAAGFGLYGDFDKTFGVSIDVPKSTASSAIKQQHYSVGARYRYAFGQHSIAAGVGYARREYVADRSGLGMAVLDMPDVTYSAIAPNAIGRFAITPTVAAFGSATFLFMLDAGPIAKSMYFGHGTITAFELAAGADIAFTPHYGMKAALEFSQVGITFDTAMRGVNGATDRTIGITASFEVLY